MDNYPYQKIKVQNNIIYLELDLYENYSTQIKTKEIDISTLEKNTIYTLSYGISGYYYFLINDKHEPLSQYAALRFYLANNGDICFYSLINTQIVPTSDNIKVIKINKNEHFNYRNELGVKYPEYKLSNIKRAEHDMMHDLIDPNYSCACQDAQIEILTKIILNIIHKNPEIFDMSTIDDFSEIKDILESTSLFNIKTSEKIKKELLNKQYIRNLQKEYYNITDTNFILKD